MRCLEHFQTDTADFADYLLPATTFLEHHDVYTSYGHYYLQYSEPVVEARGQARPNSLVFRQLGRAMGLDETALDWSLDRVLDTLLTSPNERLRGIDRVRLLTERSVKLNLPKPFLPYSDGSNFEDKKIRFSRHPNKLNSKKS